MFENNKNNKHNENNKDIDELKIDDVLIDSENVYPNLLSPQAKTDLSSSKPNE